MNSVTIGEQGSGGGRRSGVQRILLGTAPDSWGVWFADDPRQTPWYRFLDEVAEAGYKVVELGPHGYLPTDPARLRDELGRRGLQASGGGVFGALHIKERWSLDLSAALSVASLVASVGGSYLIYLPEAYRDIEGNFTYSETLTSEEWKSLILSVNQLGRIVFEEHGTRLVFHPHADTHVASHDQVVSFLEETDPTWVGLCLDTGNLAYCNVDSMEIVKNYPSRVEYVHLKQVDPAVLAEAQATEAHFAKAVAMGVMCEPPLGSPPMDKVIDALAGLQRDIFAIVEQDMYPCDPAKPLPIAKRTCSYFAGLGVGIVP